MERGERKLTQRTIIPRHLTRRTTPLKWDATDPTDVAFVVLVVIAVACVPAPLGNGAPVFDVDFHRWRVVEHVQVESIHDAIQGLCKLHVITCK
jgi:hypothetical protein